MKNPTLGSILVDGKPLKEHFNKTRAEDLKKTMAQETKDRGVIVRHSRRRTRVHCAPPPFSGHGPVKVFSDEEKRREQIIMDVKPIEVTKQHWMVRETILCMQQWEDSSIREWRAENLKVDNGLTVGNMSAYLQAKHPDRHKSFSRNALSAKVSKLYKSLKEPGFITREDIGKRVFRYFVHSDFKKLSVEQILALLAQYQRDYIRSLRERKKAALEPEPEPETAPQTVELEAHPEQLEACIGEVKAEMPLKSAGIKIEKSPEGAISINISIQFS